MKNIALLTGAIILCGSAVVFAQSDTTRMKAKKAKNHMSESDVKANTSWSKMEEKDIPMSLRTTLKDDQYKGWDSNGVYHNSTNNNYYIRTGSGQTTKAYMFDENGTFVNNDPMGTGRVPN
jgi:hypothetical protein